MGPVVRVALNGVSVADGVAEAEVEIEVLAKVPER